MPMTRICLAAMLASGVLVNAALGQDENRFGLTASVGWPSDCLYASMDSVNTVHLVLVNPVNPDFGTGEVRAVSFVSGFELRLEAYGTALVSPLRLASDGHVVARNGTYGVHFTTPIAVDPGGVTILAEADVVPVGSAVDAAGPAAAAAVSPMPCDGATGWIYLEAPVPSSIPGALVYFDAEDDDDPAVAGSSWVSWPGAPALRIEVLTVGSATGTWGGLKAVYR
ncbi:MAG: hypothetical protein R6X35_09570 [Candidatus Krumholzibacteriia bacterium]